MAKLTPAEKALAVVIVALVGFGLWFAPHLRHKYDFSGFPDLSVMTFGEGVLVLAVFLGPIIIAFYLAALHLSK